MRTLKGKVAVVGVGETGYYRHGRSPDPEFRMCLEAILAACADAGIDPREVDGFGSFSDDRNDGERVAAALGVSELRYTGMVWGGGGGGGCAAVGSAAAAIAAGIADVVVVYRALAQGQQGRFGRLGEGIPAVQGVPAYMFPYGLASPAQQFAMRVRRFMHDYGVGQEALRAVALASYHHAQANPRAVMHGRPLTPEMYDSSRWIVEPFHLFDCCMENDGAAAVVLTSVERARDTASTPAYIWAAAQGGARRVGHSTLHNDADYPTSNFKTLAARLWQMSGVTPADVDVVQSYENFTGGVVMALSEHGFYEPEEANEFLTFENLAGPDAKLPLNTSGGNLAECYVHGLELVVEAVRQVRGTSTSQVPDVEFSLVNSGPMVAPASNLLLGASPS